VRVERWPWVGRKTRAYKLLKAVSLHRFRQSHIGPRVHTPLPHLCCASQARGGTASHVVWNQSIGKLPVAEGRPTHAYCPVLATLCRSHRAAACVG